MDPEYEELIDRIVAESPNGKSLSGPGESDNQPPANRRLEAELSRVFAEESPRLAGATQARQSAQLRARAASKRAGARAGFSWLRCAAPRWAQVAAIAIVAFLIANGITVASASSLPGSPLYPVKRLAEQSDVFLAPTAGERARIWMDLAGRRLDEVQRLLEVQPRVEPRALDDIDESILHALTEIAGTRGTERIVLLKEIIQLSVREQGVLDELSQKASSDDRPRFRQSAQLLEDVAHIANSAQSNVSLPTMTVTETPTPTESPSETAPPTETETGTALPPTASPTPSPEPPTITATDQSNSSDGAEGESPAPGPSPSKNQDGGGGGQSPATPQPQNPEPTEGDKGGTTVPGKTKTQEHEKTQSPEPQRTGTPDAHPTGDANVGENKTSRSNDAFVSPASKTESSSAMKTASRHPYKTKSAQPRNQVSTGKPHQGNKD